MISNFQRTCTIPFFLLVLCAVACGGGTSETARPAPPQASAPAPPSTPLPDPPVRGPADAPVTLLEFSDYQCPVCAASTGMVDRLLAAYPRQLRLVYRQMPLLMHQYARNASKAAFAALKQGKYWEMHDALFKISDNLKPEQIQRAAQGIGLDMARFAADMNSVEANRFIKADQAAAKAANVDSTPTFFINDRLVTKPTFEAMKAMIDEALSKSR
jgi:protein-disulfide isomerase